MEVAAPARPGTSSTLAARRLRLPGHHEMGDPVGAALRIRESLSDDGTWLLVEPFAEDRLDDNLTPNRSVLLCGIDDAVHTRLSPRNRSAWHSERRPVNPGCATCSPPPASPECGGPPRPPSTFLEARP